MDPIVPFRKFPSIEQFRTVVKDVNRHPKGNDQDQDRPLTIKFTGTVKLHGTNGSVGWAKASPVLSIQSRKNLITVDKDNAGFAKFIAARAALFRKMLAQLAHDLDRDMVHVFGEWCGRGIQRGVGIAEVDPLFVVFGVRTERTVVNEEGEEEPLGEWHSPRIISKSMVDALNKTRVFHCFQFSHWDMDITFTAVGLGTAQTELSRLTDMVEQECPVAKHFGVSGVGEGIVWTGCYNDHHLRFKIKGEKHSVTKVKTLAKVDTEKLRNIEEFVEYAVTDNRLEQGYDELFTKQEEEPSNKDIGTFIRWVNGDVLKEESDTLTENGLTSKDVGKAISVRARTWFTNKMKEF